MNGEQTNRARRLRRDQTEAERKFWRQVRNRRFLELKFKRQEPVLGYFADFVCWDVKLIVEIDGGQHGEQAEYDARRTMDLESAGFHVLRWNNEVLNNIEGVMERLSEIVEIAGRDSN